jgi:hypothetical protein
MSGTATRAQIAKIWASARELGLDRETLYLLVPRGSISTLTREEASDLIERLTNLDDRLHTPSPRPASTGRRSRPARSAANLRPTHDQRNFLYFLFGRVGWLQRPERMRGFLRKFAGVSSVESIGTRKRAAALIEALKAIDKRRRDHCKS